MLLLFWIFDFAWGFKTMTNILWMCDKCTKSIVVWQVNKFISWSKTSCLSWKLWNLILLLHFVKTSKIAFQDYKLIFHFYIIVGDCIIECIRSNTWWPNNSPPKPINKFQSTSHLTYYGALQRRKNVYIWTRWI